MSCTPKPAARVRLAGLFALVAALLLALPATAARVVKVRVGTHAKFTRVVFELDHSAGYSVARETEGGAPVIIVTLDAASDTHALRSGGDIKTVQVEEGAKAVVRIALRKPNLRLQEMILANPPRIVFDVMSDKPSPVVAKSAPPKPAVAPKPAAPPKPVVAPKPAATPTAAQPAPPAPKVAETKPAPPAPMPPPEPKATAKAPAPTEATAPKTTPVGKPVQRPAPELAQKTPTPVAPKAQPAPAPTSVPTAALPKPAPAKPPGVVPLQTPAPEMPAATARVERPTAASPTATARKPLRKERLAATPPAPKPARKAAKTTPIPAPPTAAASDGFLARLTSDPLWMGGAAAGLLALFAVVFLMLRRRRALPNDLDVTAIAEESGGPGRIPAEGFSMGADASVEAAEDVERPPAGLFADAPTEPVPAPPAMETAPDASAAEDKIGFEDAAAVAIPAAESAENSLFEEDTSVSDNDSQGDARMSQDLSDLPADPRTAPPSSPPPAAAAGDTDVARMVQNLERRMSALEAKLGESNEARERLERQVAAQSEELRVQRAAIARTQRALRTMSSSDEEKATEPALRDGDTQAKTRVNV